MKKITKLALLLISTLAFTACANDSENNDNLFDSSVNPIFDKSECTILVNDKINLIDGKWTYQELSQWPSWSITISDKERTAIFNDLTTEEKTTIIENFEQQSSENNTFRWSFPIDKGIGSYVYKFEISNNEVLNAIQQSYCELYTDDELSIKVFKLLPNYTVINEKIIFKKIFTDGTEDERIKREVNYYIDNPDYYYYENKLTNSDYSKYYFEVKYPWNETPTYYLFVKD